MEDISHSIVEAGTRKVSAAREPAALTDHGHTAAVPVSPAEALEPAELRALAAFREPQARGEAKGIPHDEAFHRVFGGDGA